MPAKRNYSTDLLRCLLMIMIIIHHTIVHSLNMRALGTEEGLSDRLDYSLFLLNSFCIIAVNSFFFISGFYSIKFNSKKLIILYLEMQFYSIIWYIIMLLRDEFSLLSTQSIKYILKSALPFSSYWFMGAYFLLCILSPFVNEYVNSLNNTNRKRLLIIFSLITVIYGFVFDWDGIGRGHTFLQGMYMYFVGMLCSKNKDSLSATKTPYALIYVIISLVVSGLAYLMYRLSFPTISWLIYSYNDPFIIVSAISLSLAFIIWNSNNAIVKFSSKISKYTLAVYLITDFDYARKVVFYPLKHFIVKNNNQIVISFAIIIYAVMLFFVCILIDIIRKKLFYFIGRVLHLEDVYESFCNRCRRTAGA